MIAPIVINATDILVYSNSLNCCMGDLATKVALDISLGRSCSEENLLKLKLLKGYKDCLDQYTPSQSLIPSEGGVLIGSSSNVHHIQISVTDLNSVTTIISGVVFWAGSQALTATVLALSINTTQSIYVATSYNDTVFIQDLTGSSNGFTINSVAGSSITTTLTNFAGGFQPVDNSMNTCLSQEELIDVFESIQRICKSCLPNFNFTYLTQ